MLDGRWGIEVFAIGIPKGRDAAMPAVRKFAEDARSEGLVKRAADRRPSWNDDHRVGEKSYTFRPPRVS